MISNLRYPKSAAALERAERVIPLGAQTFSKSKLAHPHDSPLFLVRGNGARVYDVDGNEYVDCIMGLLPIILGYCDPDVDSAIEAQLKNGISFSLSTELEAEVAETMCRLIPCAEMVRFGKNGSDVTTAAVRLARAVTRRDLVFSSGYHGWADVFVGGDPLRGLGVPRSTAEQTVRYDHGDTRILDDIRKSAPACVIIEPETNPAWMLQLRQVCDEMGVILIFDEIITGFRWHIGGAQKLYGITPDLATFGKAMGNGMPINALVGSRELMKHFAPPDNIFFSGTFQGETLSLAAARATLAKLERLAVPTIINEEACSIHTTINGYINKLELQGCVKIGNLPIPRFTFKDGRLKTLFQSEMARNGVLSLGTINLSYAHCKPSTRYAIDGAIYASLTTIRQALIAGTVDNLVEGRLIPALSNLRGEEW